MNKLHVGIFNPPMHGNGLDRCTINIAKKLAEFGVRVDIVVPEITKYHKTILSTLPSEVHSIDLAIPSTKIIYFEKIIRLAKYLNKEKPVVLLAAGDYVGVSNLAKIIASSHTKIVHIVQINISRYFESLKGFKTKLRSILLRISYFYSDGIITVSRGVAEDLSNQYGITPSKIQIFYNPVDISNITIKIQEPIDHPWFLIKELPIILGAGRLMYQKDYPTLIRAFAKVRQQRTCRLVILGEESAHKAELDSLIRELNIEADVQLVGFVHNPYTYMNRASVFALSSRYEGLPNVLVEAMAIGTPVVSTDCKSGPAEILDDGRYGKLVPVGDFNALANAIIETLDRPIDSNTLQKRAQEFALDRIAEKYLNYINQLILE